MQLTETKPGLHCPCRRCRHPGSMEIAEQEDQTWKTNPCVSASSQNLPRVSVELQRQFLALRRAGALPLQACLERRGLGSCALPTHRELPFVYNWGVLRTPLFYQIKSLCNCTSAAPEPLVPQPKRSTVRALPGNICEEGSVHSPCILPSPPLACRRESTSHRSRLRCTSRWERR